MQTRYESSILPPVPNQSDILLHFLCVFNFYDSLFPLMLLSWALNMDHVAFTQNEPCVSHINVK